MSHYMVRKRQTVSYPVEGQPDLHDILVQLKGCPDSPYWNRSISDIGGMILYWAAQEEKSKYIVESDNNARNVRDSDAKP